MAIHVMENYVSVEEYAKLCGISRRSVMNRVKAETISAFIIDGICGVDKVASPPKKFFHHKWKKPGGGGHHVYADLRAVIPWCNGKSIRCYPYLRAIINGTIDGWVMAGEVFAKASDLETFRKK